MPGTGNTAGNQADRARVALRRANVQKFCVVIVTGAVRVKATVWGSNTPSLGIEQGFPEEVTLSPALEGRGGVD